ncbi:RNA-binding KH domain-containing protein RCF3-like [Rhododendron vialii]|uniref:RNA-binding KH domain-containing protein RCF3-like n=1 Tax=Rhododendron vialii TaxID=182163 RepID=UPI00265D9E88|nr:RNA-binding KH domain-containing protein RCF3-like [Rhododendron vialii]XP_058226273.1 RNA-binding KH domain-containing protein RCF3-like [Rhododendron vialii]
MSGQNPTQGKIAIPISLSLSLSLSPRFGSEDLPLTIRGTFGHIQLSCFCSPSQSNISARFSSMAGQRSYGKRTHSHSDYADDGGNKRRNHSDDRDSFSIGKEDTVYRFLCPGKKIGSIIGRGGEIVKQLRADSKSKIRIGETVRGCEERVVTIYSSSEETNRFDDSDDMVCPAQDALFRVHDRVVAEELGADENMEETPQVTVKLLVPSDQIGGVIGKGGQIVQNIRSETGAQIRILKDDHLPACALGSDELVQISGEPRVVRKALYQIASRLHDNPSRSQHLLASATANVYPSSGTVLGPGGPIIGLAPLGPYGGYKGDRGDWSRPYYSASRDGASSKEFSLCLVCPTVNLGGVIGKGGTIINQIRQETGAAIKVDSSAAEGDDCLISISAKENFEDAFSPTIEAALRLQSRCSEKVERDSGLISFTTRLLVPTSRVGCLIGKGGSIINEMRRITQANIRVLSKGSLPKVAAEDDEMVQISGDPDLAKDALVQVTSRLRANLFDREGAVSAMLPVLPYLPMSADGSDGLKYDSRDSRRHGRGPYSSGYGDASDLPSVDGYGSYGGSQSGGNGGGYGAYGGYSSGRTDSSMFSGKNPVSRRKNYDY